MIPGALLGLGAGVAAGGKSQTLALLCALAAIALAIVAEWLRAPFAKDQSLLYFITHLHQLDRAAVKLIMMAFGAVFAWWFGQGR